MHRCLGVLDILHNIFDYVDADKWCRTRWILALALTCRAFEDSALDVLWRSLPNLVPLVRCLPASALEEEAVMDRFKFKRIKWVRRGSLIVVPLILQRTTENHA
jgi:hypothetical protein